MRHDRLQAEHRDFQRLLAHGTGLCVLACMATDRVHELHHRGDRRVEDATAANVVLHFREGLVRDATQILVGRRQGRGIERHRRAVSAPYFSVSEFGSTPLLRDLDIVPKPS